MQIAKCKIQIEETLISILPGGRRHVSGSASSNLQFAICNLQFAILFVLFFSLSSLRAQAAQPDRPEAPLVGRQEPFCGAVGSGRFKVTTTATPTELQAGDPIRLTIRIESVGAWQRAPERPDLLRKPEYARFRENFHVANDAERLAPQQGKWEFDFSLRPRNKRVTEIPSLFIVYFRPGLTPPEKGYMTTSAPAIALQVKARAKVEVNEIQGKIEPAQPPDRLYQIVTGPQVLQRENRSFLHDWLLLLLIVGPPALSVGWFAWYTHRNPDVARRRRLRKSRAGRQALQALQSLHAAEPSEAARRVAGIVAGYLRHRFNLEDALQPAALGANHGTDKLSSDQRTRLAELLEKCDSVRYAPPPAPSHQRLTSEATELILDWESPP
jgi:hypothetical protein